MNQPMGTDETCPDPSVYGGTHHLAPRRDGMTTQGRGGGGPAEPAYVQSCRYCGMDYRNGVMVPRPVKVARS